MYSIGQFSKICGVSIKTLRHYHEISLLRASSTDPFTGYRYYDAEQTSVMLLISRLKRYGFSLAEIADILSCDDQTLLFSRMERQRHILAQSIISKENALHELEEHLMQFKQGGSIMNYAKQYDVQLEQSKETPVLSSRQEMSVDDFGRYFGTLMEKVAKENLHIAGNFISIYHDEAFDPSSSDIEVAIPIVEKDKATRILPEMLCACAIHTGSYATLTEAYAAISNWIEEKQYKINGAPFEIYESSHMQGEEPSKWRTKICFPIAK